MSRGKRVRNNFLQQVMADLSFSDEEALTGQVKDWSGQGGENSLGKGGSRIKGMETGNRVNQAVQWIGFAREE